MVGELDISELLVTEYPAGHIKGGDTIFTSSYKAAHSKKNYFIIAEFRETPAATRAT